MPHPTITQAAAQLQQLATKERPWFALVYEDDNKQVQIIKHMRCNPVDMAAQLLEDYQEQDIDEVMDALRSKLQQVADARWKEIEAFHASCNKKASTTATSDNDELPF